MFFQLSTYNTIFRLSTHQEYYTPGNVRKTISAANSIMLQENHYYPGGMLFAESTAVYLASGSSANAYRYGGKEFLTSPELQLSSHGARMYDPALVRFITPDPLCHQTPHLSPYLYCAANPVMYVDPTGEKPTPYEASLMAAAIYKDDDNYKDLIKMLADNKWVISDFPTTIKKNHSAGTGIGMQSRLFERTTEGGTECAYVYAGTNSWEDCVEDLTQLIGITQQYPAAIRNAKKLSSELEGRELTFVGHSMGGGEASAASMATGRDAITFNAAAVSFMTKIFNGLLGKKPGCIENYVSATPDSWIDQRCVDPIFLMQSFINTEADGKRTLVPVGYLPSHGIMDIVSTLKSDK